MARRRPAEPARSRRSAATPARRHAPRRPAPGDPALIERCERALALREPLLRDPHTSACRIVNGAADGLDGLVIEKLGDVLIAQLHAGRLRLDEAAARAICAHAARRLHSRAVFRKRFLRDRSGAAAAVAGDQADPDPWVGQAVAAELPVLENGMTLLVRPYDGYATGLYLEHRDTRRRVRELAAGRAVLNTFAYTCAFSVAAALGGAACTVSVDLSRKHLEWGQRNFAANGLSIERHMFICSDVFDYYRRAQRQRRRFDLVVLDPPTFSRMRRPSRVFSITQDLERLVAGAVALLNPAGYLLLATNHRGTSQRRLLRAIEAGAAERTLEWVERCRLPLDFAGEPAYAKALLTRL